MGAQTHASGLFSLGVFRALVLILVLWQMGREDLVDGPAIHVHDLQPPTFPIHHVSHRGQAFRQLRDHLASHPPWFRG